MDDGRLVLAGASSLSGRYALQGTLGWAGLQQAVADARNTGGVRVGARRALPELVVLDDQGTRAGVRRALDALAAADLVVGPYGSDLVREAARWAEERGRVVWNHGGSADDVEGHPAVVSVASPASRYLAAVLESLPAHRRSARVLVVVGPGQFGRHAAEGAQQTAAQLGMPVVGVTTHDEVPDACDAEVLLMAGSYDEDVALLRRLRVRPAVIAAGAAGVSAFGHDAGRRAEGVLGPSQWEERVPVAVDLGPRPADAVRTLRARVVPTLSVGAGAAHVDYVSAQAYAAVLVALRCVADAGSLDGTALRVVADRLRCTTFFGRFGLGPDGRQADHELVVVQWRAGMKRIVWPPHIAEAEVEVS